MKGGYEILEHTADVGVRAWGQTLRDMFEETAWGLAEILGAHLQTEIEGETSMEVVASDRGALLVAFLNELILLHETEEAGFVFIIIERFTETKLTAQVSYGSLSGEAESTGVKAATYHRLQIRETGDGFEAHVYLDV